jgi:hypothetical protein
MICRLIRPTRHAVSSAQNIKLSVVLITPVATASKSRVEISHAVGTIRSLRRI